MGQSNPQHPRAWRKALAWLGLGFGLLAGAAATAAPTARSLAPTPPMGWNSWDAYGFTLNEAQFKANASVLAGFKAYGWRYAVIDEGWYMQNPLGEHLADRRYSLDGHGLLTPDPARFPSAAGGAGFKPLADWAHAQGLKFGLHIVRGIPKQAVADNAPIEGSAFHAADAADTADTCPWDDGDYGVKDNPAGQAYYDSMMRLYAGWGVDFVKVDCIADHPYKASEIRQIAAAIQKTGRPMLLSLSPGPAQLANADVLARYSQMWRIADDLWDGWSFTHDKPGEDFPNGVRSGFDNLAAWNAHAGPGHWPDADMLPFGMLAPHPGWGDPRRSRLTPDETRTEFTLWAIARSPLILGANLTLLDDTTRTLMSDRALIDLNRHAAESHPVAAPADLPDARFWLARIPGRGRYLAVFNLAPEQRSLNLTWSQLGLGSGRWCVSQLGSASPGRSAATQTVTLAAHASAVFRVTAPGRCGGV